MFLKFLLSHMNNKQKCCVRFYFAFSSITMNFDGITDSLMSILIFFLLKYVQKCCDGNRLFVCFFAIFENICRAVCTYNFFLFFFPISHLIHICMNGIEITRFLFFLFFPQISFGIGVFLLLFFLI